MIKNDEPFENSKPVCTMKRWWKVFFFIFCDLNLLLIPIKYASTAMLRIGAIVFMSADTYPIFLLSSRSFNLFMRRVLVILDANYLESYFYSKLFNLEG